MNSMPSVGLQTEDNYNQCESQEVINVAQPKISKISLNLAGLSSLIGRRSFSKNGKNFKLRLTKPST